MQNLGNVVGLIKRETAPAKKFVIWAKILDPSAPDVVKLYVFDNVANDWIPFDATDGFYLPPVAGFGTTTPPGSPSAGERYIIGASATGEWFGKDTQYAEWTGLAWDYTVPRAGQRSSDTGSHVYVFNGTIWKDFDITGGGNPLIIQGTDAVDATLEFRSADGGNHDQIVQKSIPSWGEITPPFSEQNLTYTHTELKGVAVLSALHWVFVGNDESGNGLGGTIAVTRDGGNTFAFQSPSLYPHFEAVCFYDDNHGFLVMRPQDPAPTALIYKTLDGGDTWIEVNPTGLTDPMTGGTKIAAIPGLGIILNDGTNSGAVPFSGYYVSTDDFSSATQGQFIAGVNTTFRCVTILPSSVIWAAGYNIDTDELTIMSSNDQGVTFTTMFSIAAGDGQYPVDITFVDDQTAFVVTDGGTTYATTNGGVDWASTGSVIRGSAQDPSFAFGATAAYWYSATKGVVNGLGSPPEGSRGVMFQTKDAGATWELIWINHFQYTSVNQFSFADGTLVGVGSDNLVLAPGPVGTTFFDLKKNGTDPIRVTGVDDPIDPTDVVNKRSVSGIVNDSFGYTQDNKLVVSNTSTQRPSEVDTIAYRPDINALEVTDIAPKYNFNKSDNGRIASFEFNEKSTWNRLREVLAGDSGTNGIFDFHFLNANIGAYIQLVDDVWSLWTTSDGGQTWTQKTVPLSNGSFEVVRVIDTNTIALVGTNPASATIIVSVSADGGDTWGDIIDLHYPSYPDGGFQTAYSMQIVSSTVWIISGSGVTQAVLYKTTDGGVTWTWLDEGNSLDQSSSNTYVFFLSPTIGYLLTSDFNDNIGILLKTTDGGATWSVINNTTLGASAADSMQSSMYWLSSTHGFIGDRTQNILYQTTDGGVTLVPIDGVAANQVQGFGTTLIAILGNTSYKSINSGADWTAARSVDGHSGFTKSTQVISSEIAFVRFDDNANQSTVIERTDQMGDGSIRFQGYYDADRTKGMGLAGLPDKPIFDDEATSKKYVADQLAALLGSIDISWSELTGLPSSNSDLVSYVAAQISALVAAAPGALDTLNELATALGDDPAFATTVTNSIALKVAIADIVNDLTTGGAAKVLSAQQGVVLKGLIDGLTTSKLNISDVINDLTTGGAAKALSASQGVALKSLVDAKVAISSIVNDLTTGGTAVPLSAEQGKTLKGILDAMVQAKAAATAGTDTYTATIVGIAAYAANDTYLVKFGNANTGPATLNINALGAKAIKKNSGVALAAADISAGQVMLLAYDGVNFQVIGNISSGGGGASITDITKSALATAITGATLTKGQPYRITDPQDGGKIIVTAIDTDKVSADGSWVRDTLVRAFGYFRISAGNSGNISQITVNGTNLLTTTVNYATSRLNTANLIATNANANSGVSGYRIVVIPGSTLTDSPVLVIQQTTAGVNTSAITVTASTLTIAENTAMAYGLASVTEEYDIDYDVVSDHITRAFDKIRGVSIAIKTAAIGSQNPIVNFPWGDNRFSDVSLGSGNWLDSFWAFTNISGLSVGHGYTYTSCLFRSTASGILGITIGNNVSFANTQTGTTWKPSGMIIEKGVSFANVTIGNTVDFTNAKFRAGSSFSGSWIQNNSTFLGATIQSNFAGSTIGTSSDLSFSNIVDGQNGIGPFQSVNLGTLSLNGFSIIGNTIVAGTFADVAGLAKFPTAAGVNFGCIATIQDGNGGFVVYGLSAGEGIALDIDDGQFLILPLDYVDGGQVWRMLYQISPGDSTSAYKPTIFIGGSVAGNLVVTIRNISADDSHLREDGILQVDSSGGAVNVSLLPVGSYSFGKIYTIKDIGGAALTNNITLTCDGADKIDGASTKVIALNYGSFDFYVGAGGKFFTK